MFRPTSEIDKLTDPTSFNSHDGVLPDGGIFLDSDPAIMLRTDIHNGDNCAFKLHYQLIGYRNTDSDTIRQTRICFVQISVYGYLKLGSYPGRSLAHLYMHMQGCEGGILSPKGRPGRTEEYHQ